MTLAVGLTPIVREFMRPYDIEMTRSDLNSPSATGAANTRTQRVP
jgi:hypothetical protein